jgi:hypothetical protein
MNHWQFKSICSGSMSGACGEECRKEEESCLPVCSQVEERNATGLKQNKEDYNYLLLLVDKVAV